MKPWLRLTLIVMTVGGGFAGFAVTLQTLFSSLGGPPLNLLLILIFTGLYAFVVASGLLFVHDPARTKPLLAALAMQIPSVSSSTFLYRFAAGLAGIVTLSGPEKANSVGLHYGWELFFGGSWRVSFAQGNPLAIGVNLVALTLFLLLWKTAQPAKVETPPRQGSF